MKSGIIVIAIILMIIVGTWILNEPIHINPYRRPIGRFFTVEWVEPDGVIFYRGFMSGDSAKIKNTPFECQRLRMSPPKKSEGKQRVTIQYYLNEKPYDLYVRVFAFNIDGNYRSVNLLNFE